MIEMCTHIRDRWSRKKLLLAATELDIMEQSYVKYHTYLALALHNAVQHKDADYCKFQNLLAVLSIFQHCCPQFAISKKQNDDEKQSDSVVKAKDKK